MKSIRIRISKATALVLLAAMPAIAQTTGPAADPAFDSAPEAKAACDALFARVRQGDIDAALKGVVLRTRHPDPLADARERMGAIAKLMKRGMVMETRDGYRRGTVAMVPLITHHPARPDRIDPDPLLVVLRDGEWKMLLSSKPDQPSLSAEERAAAEALTQKWKSLEPSLTAPATQP